VRKWWLVLLSVVVVGAISALPPAIMLILKVARLDLSSDGVVVVPNLSGGAFTVASSLILAILMFLGADLLRFAAANKGYKLRFELKLMPAGLLVGGCLFLLSALISGFEGPTTHSLLSGLQQNPQPLQALMYVLALVVIAPLAEEWLFRGSILPILADSFGQHLALILSAIAFALAHGLSKMSWFYVLAGMCFALLVKRKRSLLPAIVAHATFNFFTIVYILLIVQ